ncbi:16S rRNA (guanine(966)-N(2))-methyltransferase RsmD [Dermatobacter hominis]|uniref:16S rRNA (guanine(966)-N(2))-methyltransferase RsmD n=1 Tax=Dermatobacter hominis TaxID=2884263 RepID=UPI001D0F9267|nr:16S rRNA (guanine(966)-N(2))-methyltransferase RsmD [Dermatobacter hominis]UDY36896.1 16S rRNA (guanine(966)-N(2))-methyltransferase RsmD [Dermatobacter hominis]
MRVVAGTARGRRLVTPPGRDVRPTLDRVRESVFNALGSLDALRGATVLDLFAGSGALGVEALSRGAGHVTFVDSSPASIDAVRANLDATGFAASATVLRRDALDVLRGGDGARALGGPVDLVLADPPYSFDRWGDLMVALRPALSPDAVVVVESDRSIEDEVRERLAELGGGILRERRYGGTVVAMLSFQGQPPSRSARGPADPGPARGPADPGSAR